MDHVDLVAELESVLDALAGASVEAVICGGMAVLIHGYVRATADLDLLVQRDDVDAAREAVRPLGYDVHSGRIPFGLGTPAERELYRVSKVVGDELLSLDLLVVTPVLESAWASRTRFEWRGRQVTVVSREGLAEMKRLASRHKDLADLEALGLLDEHET